MWLIGTTYGTYDLTNKEILQFPNHFLPFSFYVDQVQKKQARDLSSRKST